MKCIFKWATGIIIAFVATSSTIAQTGTAIAVLDVNSVFEQNLRFKQAMADIRSDIKNYEAEVVEKRKLLDKKQEAAGEYNPDSQQYRDLEKQYAKMTADLQIDMQLKKKAFMEREAKIYYQAYIELERFVSEYSRRRSVALVVRFVGDEINSRDRASILAGVNRPVVFFSPTLDITQPILEMVNHGVAPPKVGRQSQVPTRRR